MELVKTLPSKLVGPAKKLLEGLPQEVVIVAIAQCVWRRWDTGASIGSTCWLHGNAAVLGLAVNFSSRTCMLRSHIMAVTCHVMWLILV
jgi:hypothetical protein